MALLVFFHLDKLPTRGQFPGYLSPAMAAFPLVQASERGVTPSSFAVLTSAPARISSSAVPGQQSVQWASAFPAADCFAPAPRVISLNLSPGNWNPAEGQQIVFFPGNNILTKVVCYECNETS
ncbi:MAG: hypothetical protein V3T65_04345 [Acidobacteriota bacterium]